MKNIKDKLWTAGGVILAAGISIGLQVWIVNGEQNKENRRKVEYILDEDKNGRLSTDEIKRYFDEMGINLYTKSALDEVSAKSREEFLSRYELKPVKKQN
jgi:hypothetical protein